MFKKVVVGISGGVDSAVVSLLLKNKGFNVQAVFMKNWDIADEKGECQADKDYEDANYICNKLKIPLMEVNFVKEYWNEVFSYFLESYQNGETPNPDVRCNKMIKFNKFFDFARHELKADAIATGHYARTDFGPFLENYRENTNNRLLSAKDFYKDQTFFLCQIPQESLRKCMFPLGNYYKKDIKKMAIEADLMRIVQKKESMGICFIGTRNYRDFISEYLEDKPGNFVEYESGTIIGTHKGIHHWTIGQRVGISPWPYFVYSKNVATNDILVVKGTSHPALFSDLLVTQEPHWISKEPAELRKGNTFHCDFRFQHLDHHVQCTVFQTQDKKLIIRLGKGLRAITEGQFAVLYKNDECIGSAKIIDTGPTYYNLNRNVKVLENEEEKQQMMLRL